MTLTIWKYQLVVGGVTVIPMPKQAQVLGVHEQHTKPNLWALVNPDNEQEDRKFTVIGTGHLIPYPDRNLQYVGTFQLLNGDFVGHAFELVNI